MKTMKSVLPKAGMIFLIFNNEKCTAKGRYDL